MISETDMHKNNYTGKQALWEKGASIRTRPRRLLPEFDDCDYYFPISRQPLCVHPIIVSMGEESKIFILTQSVYKFMMDIAILETEVVNSGAILVANGKLNIHFPEGLRHDALSVIIDEAYHAYVAMDFIKQIECKTGFKPIEMPKQTAALISIKYIKEQLPTDLRDIFELIAVCIGEHVLTKDLISIGKETSVSKTFLQVMADHVTDEGRHANIFNHVLEILWSEVSEGQKNLIGPYIPLYMLKYLQTNSYLQKEYDRSILSHLNLSEENINNIMNDTYVEYKDEIISKINPVISNLINMLEHCRVLDHRATKDAFIREKFI